MTAIVVGDETGSSSLDCFYLLDVTFGICRSQTELQSNVRREARAHKVFIGLNFHILRSIVNISTQEADSELALKTALHSTSYIG